MFLLFFYLFLALVVSFVCSVMEASLLSTPNSFLIVNKESGNKWATIFIRHKLKIDRPLAAILSLNTVAHTIGAAGVGAQATLLFGEVYFGLVSVVLTLLILFVSEIIPKTIGARYWRNLAKISAYTIRVMIWITYPLVWLSGLVSSAFSRKEGIATTSREEISALASIGVTEGIFDQSEYRIIENLLKLRNVKVEDVMTPRIVVASADEKRGLNDFLQDEAFKNFSRIPVYSGNKENITGYVLRQDAFERMTDSDGANLTLSDLKRPIVVVPNIKPLFSVWETLLEQKEHIAVIVDEYGGMSGIATMEDIIETILGLEIIDEKDSVTDMREYAKERWQMRQRKHSIFQRSKEKGNESGNEE